MPGLLSRQQRQNFIDHGFIRLDGAFPDTLASQARELLWSQMNCDPHNPKTWNRPVIRLGMYTDKPFVEAANTQILHDAFDNLVGADNWLPCKSMGTFPIRFPSTSDPGDTGWHVDAGFPGENPANFFDWRINVTSKGRALLMLFLFSDVGEYDAPTRIRVGSHKDVAKLLKPAGERGMSFGELSQKLINLPPGEEVQAIGKAGTVYLCHPFLVHAAQRHDGKEPRFLAQPPLLLRKPLVFNRPDSNYTALEESILRAIY